jgi:hypothetical protein
MTKKKIYTTVIMYANTYQNRCPSEAFLLTDIIDLPKYGNQFSLIQFTSYLFYSIKILIKTASYNYNLQTVQPSLFVHLSLPNGQSRKNTGDKYRCEYGVCWVCLDTPYLKKVALLFNVIT